ncbi:MULTISPECIES: D-sedoheptulose-7-phosphate isomerase [Thiomicrorhabdus]|uniref:SIS domain-containing protein n=1 Tax=Thiomicrorhabdus heinhorstiae TaxID=2748010 RepID=A0ABS0BVY5_9GAMM|nr:MULTISPECIES: SIS domain-containing protein [Thiomicrorhabdus]MBF6057949.1 SIS domain-containing protein [Thiomicrorhabdus heinhorstiae]
MVRIGFEHALQSHHAAIESVLQRREDIVAMVEKIAESLDKGGKVLWLGNGGSAADAQHMAAELMVRYVKDRRPLASLALTTDSSILTAHSNDYAFQSVFARQIEALASKGDIVIAMSTSGNSQNVVEAVEEAKRIGCFSIAMTGREESRLSELADICFRIDCVETARIQEAHTFLNHLICEGLDSIYAS